VSASLAAAGGNSDLAGAAWRRFAAAKRRGSSLTPTELRTPDGLRRIAFSAMGTTVEVLVPERHLDTAGDRVRETFRTWEAAFSRFDPASDLSALNRSAGRAARVAPLLFSAVQAALSAASATGGLYDPTLLRSMVAVGYDRSFGDLPGDGVAARAPVPGGGWRQVRLDPARHEVTCPPGVEFDLGGIAKGMAVDAALDVLAELGIASALVSAGGDLGVLGRPPGEDSWMVSVEGPRGDALVPLVRGALATSSVLRRRWREGGRERHHILDPRTGEPASAGLASVSVVATRCREAEVAAKVTLVLGAADGAAFLDELGLAGLLVEPSGAAHTVGAWPREAVPAA